MLRRRLAHRHTEEAAQTEAVGTTPGDAALAVDPLEVADQEHAEIDARRNRIPAHVVGVMRPAQRFDMAIEARVAKEAIELVVEDVAGGLRQIRGRDPEFPLLFARTAAHAHVDSLRVFSIRLEYRPCHEKSRPAGRNGLD